jgi:Questin oxidase-like
MKTAMDEALEILAPYGPDLENGMTSHAPMTAEALCAMDRSEAVLPWIERYRKGMMLRPAPRERISAASWRDALGREERYADWFPFFEDALAVEPWPAVVDRWLARLAPGISAAATHGVIRVGHAVRSLDTGDSPAKRRELADGLAYFAATYRELPFPSEAREGTAKPSEAIAKVAVVPPAERKFSGTITSSLDRLADFPAFAPVIDLIDVRGDASSLISDMTETFARVYLANAADFLTAIVFVHGVTSATAVRSLLPHLAESTTRAALRFVWQAGCGLYASFGSRPRPAATIEPPRESSETLVDLAIENGDEHAIKVTEACLREQALNPSPAYLACARHAIGILRAG